MPGAAQPLLTQPPGYILCVDAHRLDLAVFERTCDTARHALADGRAAEAAQLFGAALAAVKRTLDPQGILNPGVLV